MTFQRKFFCLREACTTRQSPPPPFLSLNKKQGRRSTRRDGTAKSPNRNRRRKQPVPSPGLRPPELLQTERFVGVYHTPIFTKMQSFFSKIAWNSTLELPAPWLYRSTKSGARSSWSARRLYSVWILSEGLSAAAAVIPTAAAIPAAAAIPTAPTVSTAAAENDDQHNDPQAASAAPAVIAAPHIEVPPEYEDLRRRCAALKLSYVRGRKGLQI